MASVNIISTVEAEAAIQPWIAATMDAANAAEQLAEYAAENFTAENLKAGLLINGYNAMNQAVPWTEAELERVQALYAVAREFAEYMRKQGNGKNPKTMLQCLQAVFRRVR